MIPKKLHWTLVIHLAYLLEVTRSQNARSYDTNDWIPVTPSSSDEPKEEGPTKKATGRVLNLDPPAQKFFPDEYKRRRPPPPQQYEQKGRYNGQKYDSEYKFEVPRPPPPPLHKGAPHLQYFTNQEVLPAYDQPPPPPRQPAYIQNPPRTVLPVRDRVPSPNAPSIYEQYNIPFNNSYYQSLNPTAINQELLGGIQHNPQNLGPVRNLPVTLPPPVVPSREKESVQLVYVPLENLKATQPLPQNSQTIYKQVESPRQPLISNTNQQQRLENIENDFVAQALQAHKLQQQIQLGQPIVLQTTTTQRPSRRRKPHQPPLAVYMETNNQAGVDDVLQVLKDAKSIAVQDSVQSDSPSLFIGPSSLSPPNGYSKFPLPYLNSIDGNRVERKVDNLPFFVAPLSYKTPTGYSKIPLPSPHVGSVIVSQKNNDSGKRATGNRINESRIEEVPTVTASPEVIYDATPLTSFDNQNYYYTQMQNLIPQNPQYVQFNVNDNVKQLNIPTESYIQQPQFANLQAYSIPIRTQTFDTTERHRNTEKTYYPIVKENDDIRSNIYANHKPAKNYEGVENKYQNHRFPPSQTYSIKQQQSSRLPSQFYEENVTKHQEPSNSQTERSPPRTRTPTEHNTPTRTTPRTQLTEENQSVYNTPYKSTQKYKQTRNNGDSFNTPSRTTPSIRYNPVSSTPSTKQKSEDSPVQITPRSTTPNPAVVSEGIINSYYNPTSSQQTQVDVSPLDLAINEYELYQINSQFQERPKSASQLAYSPQNEEHVNSQLKENYSYQDQTEEPDIEETYEFDPQLHRFANTPATILRDTYETTLKPTPKTRRRGRPTKPTTTETPSLKETYTVLEEFSSRHSTTPQYQPSSKTRDTPVSAEVPASIYTLQPITEGHSGSEEIRSTYYENPLQNSQHQRLRTEIEHVPAKVYSLNVKEDSQVHSEPIRQQAEVSTQQHLTEKIVQSDVEHTTRRYQEPTQEDVYYLQRYGMQQNSETQAPHRDEQFVRPPVTQTQRKKEPQEYIQENVGSPNQYQIRQEYQDSIRSNQVPDEMAELVKSLQDQSVRSLLLPNILAPTAKSTTEHESSAEITSPTFITTTERIAETTAYTRSRSRTRGGTRYSQIASTTKKPASRRRPTTAPRTTTEKSRPTSVQGDAQRISTKQRFRTRTRTTPNIISEKISTTENEVYNGPTSEAAEYGHVVDERKIIKSRPEIDSSEDYHRVYSPSQEYTRPILQYDNTATTSKPASYEQVTYPTTVRESRLPTDVQRESPTSQSSRNNDEVKSNFRVRGKLRSRPKTPTTAATERPARRILTSVSPKKAEEDEEDQFYGFIRAPNFKSSSAQVASATQQPQFYSNSFQDANEKSDYYFRHPKEDFRVTFDNTNFESTTVHFVGEIRPKYSATTKTYETTTEDIPETPRPRIRSRIKAPQRKPVENSNNLRNHRPSYEAGSGSRNNDQTARRSNLVRSRGRTHFKTPENLRQKDDQEADVEGGNYPANFVKQKQSSTAAPSFQITVDPHGHHDDEEEDDQASHSSIYRPRLTRPEEWHEAAKYVAGDDGYASGNQVTDQEKQGNENEKDQNTTTGQPVALPIKATTEEMVTAISDNSEETFREKTKAIDSLFEAVNQFDQVQKASGENSSEAEGRKRGTWKLVRHRPIDHFEVAESQNYRSVLNMFDGIEKVDPSSKISEKLPLPTGNLNYNNFNLTLEQNSDSYDYESHKSNTLSPTGYSAATIKMPQPNDELQTSEEDEQYTSEPEETTLVEHITTTPTISITTPRSNSFIDSFYELLGMSVPTDPAVPEKSISNSAERVATDGISVSVTTLAPPTFPEEITEQPSTTTKNNTDSNFETTTLYESSITTTTELPINTYQVVPWEMRQVRTSTSTEISHETEICYKGRCIKSLGKTKRS